MDDFDLMGKYPTDNQTEPHQHPFILQDTVIEKRIQYTYENKNGNESIYSICNDDDEKMQIFFIQDAAEKCMWYIYTELRTVWCEENEWSNTSNIDAHEKLYIHVC